MKKYITIIILLVSFNLMAQNKNVTVTYSPLLSGSYISEEVKKNNPSFASNYNGVETLINAKKIYLHIKDSISIYKTNAQLKTDEQEESTAEFTANLIVGHGDVYYKNLKSNKLIHHTEFGGTRYNINMDENLIHWELNSEKKQIDNFTVYKATGFDSIRNVNVIAWYCPEIPVMAGPMNYTNLPGLVLEIEIGKKLKFVAKQVESKIDEQTDFGIPKGKSITRKKFNTIVDNHVKEYFQK